MPRNEFTYEEKELLAKYLSKFDKRSGNVIYKSLTENKSKYPWSGTHTWQSWREQYSKNKVYYEDLIQEFQRKRSTRAAATAQKDQKAGTIEDQLRAREKIRESRALNNPASPSRSNSQVNNSQLEHTRNTIEPASFTQAERSIIANQSQRDTSILGQSNNDTPGDGSVNDDDDSRPVLELLPLHMVDKVNENITEEQRDILMDTLIELSSVDTFALEIASERLNNQFDPSELGSFIYHDLGKSFIKKKKKDNKTKQFDKKHNGSANANISTNEEVRMDIGESNKENTNENDEASEQTQDRRESYVDEQSNSQQRETSETRSIPPALKFEDNSRLTISPNVRESPILTSDLNEAATSKRKRSESEGGVDLREEGEEEEVDAEDEEGDENEEVDQLDELNQAQVANSENQSEERPVKMEMVQQIEQEDQDQGARGTAQEEQVRRAKQTKPAKGANEAERAGPVKRKRVEFSREDDDIIVAFLRRYKNKQKGNNLWKKLGEKKDNHSFHSWRERYVKRMSDFNKRVENEEYDLADFGIYMTSDEEDNGCDSDGAFSDPENSLNKRRMGRENIVKGETRKETRERIAREKQAHYKKRTGQALHRSDNDEQEIEDNEIKMAPAESFHNIVDNASAASPEIKQEPTDENTDGGNEMHPRVTNEEPEPPGSTQMLMDAATSLEQVNYTFSESEHSDEEIDDEDEAEEASTQLFNQFLTDYPISKAKLEDLLFDYDYNFKNVKKVLDQATAK